MKGKRKLFLVIDKNDKSAKSKTVVELRDFISKKLGKAKLLDAIEGIYCIEASEDALEALNESKLDDYIDSKKWSKEDALKPENLKELKKMTKQNDEKTKVAIERHFAKSSDAKKDKVATKKGKSDALAKKTIAKKDASKTSSTYKNKDTTKDVNVDNANVDNAKDNASEQPANNEKAHDTAIKGDIKIFDNKFVDVKTEKDNISFVFTKSKAEIALDKKNASVFGA